jgi:hypothetical protein
LIDVSKVDTSTTLLGSPTPLPIGIAPSAMQRLAGGDGEIDAAKAAAGMYLNLTLSSQSTTSLEDVIAAKNELQGPATSAPPFWMQLYLHEDMQKSVPLIKRAEGRINSVLFWNHAFADKLLLYSRGLSSARSNRRHTSAGQSPRRAEDPRGST